jgi:hypothetical protein
MVVVVGDVIGKNKYGKFWESKIVLGRRELQSRVPYGPGPSQQKRKNQ